MCAHTCVCTYVCMPVRTCVCTVVPRRTQSLFSHGRWCQTLAAPQQTLQCTPTPCSLKTFPAHSSGVNRICAYKVSRDTPGEQLPRARATARPASDRGHGPRRRVCKGITVKGTPHTAPPPRTPTQKIRGPEVVMCPQQLGRRGRGAIDAAGVTSTGCKVSGPGSGSDWTLAPPGALSAGQGRLSKEVQAVSPKGNQS